MNRKAFYVALRARNSGVFGTSVSQEQVNGCEALLDALERHRVYPIGRAANVLAQVYHETGGGMWPVKETVYRSSKERNPSDAKVAARLDAAFRKGQLPWVKTPYWRGGWFGRGMIQITHESNYRKLGRRLGVDLVGNRDLTLDPRISADIAVVGMNEGLFTGKRLPDYFTATRNDPAGARAIVNGDKNAKVKHGGRTITMGELITIYHTAFAKALVAAGYDPMTHPEEATQKPPEPVKLPPAQEDPEPKKPATRPTSGAGFILWPVILILGAIIAAVFGVDPETIAGWFE